MKNLFIVYVFRTFSVLGDKMSMTARITVFLLFFCFLSLNASNFYSQSAKVSLNAKNVSIEKILSEIENQSEFYFLYNNKLIDVDRKVNIRVTEKNIVDVLDELFRDSDVSYLIRDRQIVLNKKTELQQTLQENRIITGTVKDETGELLIGVSVGVKGTSSGMVTDVNGKYSISVNSDLNILVFSYIGYTSREIAVGKQSVIDVVLREEIHNLGEVVVTALGIKRSEKALGYSVQKIGGGAITEVKGVDFTTSLTGKIAGLNIRNSTDFFNAPTIVLRGATPLIVIDGVPSGNVGLRELAADDIESFQVLKGGAASALYGEKGKDGAIMITTKRGKQEGVTISVNSNTMFHKGFLRLPEVHSSYSSGVGGNFKSYDEVWGDRLDIGRTAKQYNPLNYEWEEMPLVSKGKDNLQNFMENSFITNNNINVAYKGKTGTFRTSLNHIYNKGVFPNNKENRFSFTVSGDVKLNNKLTVDASMTFNKRYSPNIRGAGYGWAGYIYNMMVWTGSDWDVRDFSKYWKAGKENLEQNWHYDNWYNNPYFIAYETTYSTSHDRLFGQFNTTYEFAKWLKTIARAGFSNYYLRDEQRYPMSHRSYRKGQYTLTDGRSNSINGDLIALLEFKLGDFTIDGLFGGSIDFRETNSHTSNTKGGLSIPGYYSLAAGIDGVTSSGSISKYQTNSLYGKAGVSWKSTVFLEATGRNDWASTLAKDERSYFYPSVAGSFIVSELLPMPKSWFSFWKLRASWAMSKITPGYNDINAVYTINPNIWDGVTGASLSSSIRPKTLKPEEQSDWEIGTEFYFLNNRLKFDFAYYERLNKHRLTTAAIAGASGYTSVWANMDEERVRRGYEITISGDPIKTDVFEWNASVNWSRDRLYYKKIDSQYAEDYPWVHNGAPVNLYTLRDWEKDPAGNLILSNGLPMLAPYPKVIGNMDPDWIWGFTNEFRYKDFHLMISLDGRIGGYGWDQTEQALWHSGAHIDSNTSWRYEEVVNGNVTFVPKGVKVISGSVKYDSYGQILEDTRVFAPNDVAVSYEAYTKQYNAQPYGSVRSQWVNDMTFFKLRELSLGYKIPKVICGKIGLKTAEVSLVGQNLLMWSKNFKHSDPDGSIETTGLVTPSVRYMGFNVKFDF